MLLTGQHSSGPSPKLGMSTPKLGSGGKGADDSQRKRAEESGECLVELTCGPNVILGPRKGNGVADGGSKLPTLQISRWHLKGPGQ